MAGESGNIGHDDMIAEPDVMRDVRIGEDMIVRADAGRFAVRQAGLRLARSVRTRQHFEVRREYLQREARRLSGGDAASL